MARKTLRLRVVPANCEWKARIALSRWANWAVMSTTNVGRALVNAVE